MQLTKLSIEEEIFPQNLPKDGTKPMVGTVEFTGTCGCVKIPLTKKDIKNIQELLYDKLLPMREEI